MQLTPDQSAAVLSVLTNGKRVSVINAPARGKTRVMTEAARVWAAAGRPVVGITPSQSALNTLAAGVAGSYDTAQFLGYLPGQRGARGPLAIAEGALLLVDESSMISAPIWWPDYIEQSFKAVRRSEIASSCVAPSPTAPTPGGAGRRRTKHRPRPARRRGARERHESRHPAWQTMVCHGPPQQANGMPEAQSREGASDLEASCCPQPNRRTA